MNPWVLLLFSATRQPYVYTSLRPLNKSFRGGAVVCWYALTRSFPSPSRPKLLRAQSPLQSVELVGCCVCFDMKWYAKICTGCLSVELYMTAVLYECPCWFRLLLGERGRLVSSVSFVFVSFRTDRFVCLRMLVWRSGEFIDPRWRVLLNRCPELVPYCGLSCARTLASPFPPFPSSFLFVVKKVFVMV